MQSRVYQLFHFCFFCVAVANIDCTFFSELSRICASVDVCFSTTKFRMSFERERDLICFLHKIPDTKATSAIFSTWNMTEFVSCTYKKFETKHEFILFQQRKKRERLFFFYYYSKQKCDRSHCTSTTSSNDTKRQNQTYFSIAKRGINHFHNGETN